MNKSYDGTYLQKLQTFYARTKQRSYELLNAQPQETIIDIGCGVGEDVANIVQSGANVIGIDNDPEFIEIAKENCTNTFICCEAASIPLADNSVDKIRFDRVFQHIANHNEVLQESSRILKPEGMLQIIDADYLGMTLFLEDEKLERKIIDTIAYNRIPNGHKTRKLPTILRDNGFAITATEIHHYLIDDYVLLNQIIRFDKVVNEEYQKGNFTREEWESWQEHNRKKQLYFSFDLFILQAAKGQ